jgi:hypothetical protein
MSEFDSHEPVLHSFLDICLEHLKEGFTILSSSSDNFLCAFDSIKILNPYFDFSLMLRYSQPFSYITDENMAYFYKHLLNKNIIVICDYMDKIDISYFFACESLNNTDFYYLSNNHWQPCVLGGDRVISIDQRLSVYEIIPSLQTKDARFSEDVMFINSDWFPIVQGFENDLDENGLIKNINVLLDLIPELKGLYEDFVAKFNKTRQGSPENQEKFENFMYHEINSSLQKQAKFDERAKRIFNKTQKISVLKTHVEECDIIILEDSLVIHESFTETVIQIQSLERAAHSKAEFKIKEKTKKGNLKKSTKSKKTDQNKSNPSFLKKFLQWSEQPEIKSLLPFETDSDNLELRFNIGKKVRFSEKIKKHSIVLVIPNESKKVDIMIDESEFSKEKKQQNLSNINNYINEDLKIVNTVDSNVRFSDIKILIENYKINNPNSTNTEIKLHTSKLKLLIRKLYKNNTHSISCLKAGFRESIIEQVAKSHKKINDQLLKKEQNKKTRESAVESVLKAETMVKKDIKEEYTAAKDLNIDEIYESCFDSLCKNNEHRLSSEFFLENYDLPNMEGFNEKSKEFFSRFLNHEIEFCFKLCTILYDLSQASLDVTMKKGNFLKMSENMFDITAILINSKKLTSDLSKISFVLFTTATPVLREQSIFKNYNAEENVYYTNVLNYSYNEIIHKSEVFYDMIVLCYLMFIRGQNIETLRKFFFKLFNLLFVGGLYAKCLLSFSKYSNMVALSSFSKSQNLLDKYIGKNLVDRNILYYYARCVFSDFKNNIRNKDILVSNRTQEKKTRMTEPVVFTYMNLKSHTIEEMIEMSVFYTFAFKDTTNYTHDMCSFVKTISNNNNYILNQEILNKGLIHETFNTNLKSKFLIKDVLRQSLKLFIDEKKELSEFKRLKEDDFIDTELKKELIINFESDFINMRKIAAIDVKGNKVKTTNLDRMKNYINSSFAGNLLIDPMLIINRILSEATDKNSEANVLLLAKKSQYESSREIYEQTLQGKVCTTIIQKVFKYINKLEEREMVVESQKDKISLIRDSTKILLREKKNNEVEVYHNGDMSAWSGRDIYEKFLILVDNMLLFKMISARLHALLKVCLEKTRNSRIYIGKSQDSFNENLDKLELDEQNGQYYITYKYSWAQGLYHNIGSFVHALEQRFRKKLFCQHLKLNFNYDLDPLNWFQVVHSDDKNEVILLPIELVPEFVKFNTLVPRMFALETSETKDSFSFLCSEMVGVQNIRGNIIDNGIKTISRVMDKCEDKSLIDNYKYIVSRSSAYFLKSNDIFGAQFIESLCRKRLNKISGFQENSFIPVNFGGRNQRDLISVIKYGNFSDHLCKAYINKFNFSNFVELICNKKLFYRKFISPKLRKIINKYREDSLCLDREFLNLDVVDFQERFSSMINTSIIKNKKDMIVSLDNLKFLRFMRYAKSLKYSFSSILTEFSNLEKIIPEDQKHVQKEFIEYKNLSFKRLLPDKKEFLENQVKISKGRNLELFSSLKEIEDFILDFLKKEKKTSPVSPVVITSDIALERKNDSDFRREFSIPFVYDNTSTPFNVYDSKGRTTKEYTHRLGFAEDLDIKIVDLLVQKRMNLVFQSFSNSMKKEKIIKQFNKVMNQFEVKNADDYDKKRNLIYDFLELKRNVAPLVYTSVTNTSRLEEKVRFVSVESNLQMTDIFKDVRFQFFSSNVIINESDPRVIINNIKDLLNSYIKSGNILIKQELHNILSSCDCAHSKLCKYAEDLNLVYILESLRKEKSNTNVVKYFDYKNESIGFRRFYDSFDYDNTKKRLVCFILYQKSFPVSCLIVYDRCCFFSNIKTKSFNDYSKALIKSILLNAKIKFDNIDLIRGDLVSIMINEYNIMQEFSDSYMCLEEDENNTFILNNIVKMIKNKIEFSWKSPSECFFFLETTRNPIKRKLRYYNDAPNFNENDYVFENLFIDYDSKTAKLIEETPKINPSFYPIEDEINHFKFENVRISAKESYLVSLLRKILINCINHLSQDLKIERNFNKSVNHCQIKNYYLQSNKFLNFHYFSENSDMIYSNAATRILITDNEKTLRSAAVFLKEEIDELLILDKARSCKAFPFRFKMRTRFTLLHLEAIRINDTTFVIYKDDIMSQMDLRIDELTSRIKKFQANEFMEFLTVQHEPFLKIEKDELKTILDELYSIKKLKSLNDLGNLYYSIENISDKIIRYENVSFKFKKAVKYKDEGTSYVVRTPNLRPFKIKFEKFNENEFFQKSFMSCLFLKFLYDKTKTSIFLRIYMNLKTVLQIFRIDRDKLNDFSLTDSRLFKINEQFSKINSYDNTTSYKDIYKTVNDYISYYSKSKKERQIEHNLITLETDLSKTLEDFESHSSSYSKPFIHKPILNLIKKYKKTVFKFICEIGFNKEFFDNYKNNERIIT